MGDFTAPTRSVQLPTLPSNVDKAIGAGGKPVVIKKNIFERNRQRHSDLTPNDSKDILKSALYEPSLYGQNQLKQRPYNWVVIKVKWENGNHKLVLLEIDRNKDNVEHVTDVEIYNAKSPVTSGIINPATETSSVKSDTKLAKFFDDANNASKVVDENGEPKVVYHGSFHLFTKFDNVGRHQSYAPDGAHYFSSSREIANSYNYWYGESDGELPRMSPDAKLPLDMDKFDEVIGNSIEVEEHPDVLKKDGKREWENGFSDNVLIHRFMGAVKIDGTLYRVKTTMKENRGADIANKPYTYEVTKIELLSSSIPTINSQATAPNNNSITLANLLKDVEFSYEKGKKLLEESKKSGEPRFGYIGYSMSERAHQARMEGRYPKTDFKKEYDMPQPSLDALVQAGVIDGSEWHHTSKAYNKTTFYGWNDEACIATYKAHKAEIDAWAKGIDPTTGEALPAVDDTNPYHLHETMPQGSEGRAIAEIAKRKDEARSAKIRNEV